jgi:hypothetical protein
VQIEFWCAICGRFSGALQGHIFGFDLRKFAQNKGKGQFDMYIAK